jgi:type IV pilus assembly protein PilV
MSLRRAPVCSAGFTLAEVLAAMLVVALGVAGAATLHTRALRAGREAARLSAATRLAAALSERMRANPAAMALPDADNPYLQLDYDAAAGAPPPAGACYADADCTPDALAAFDRFETAQAVAAQLPGGRVRVCRDAAAPAAAGLLPWACDGQAGAPLAIKLGWRAAGAADAPSVLLLVGAGLPADASGAP